MKLLTKKYLLLLFLFMLFVGKAQHDPMYSNYIFNGLLINPAYSGSNGVLNGTISYKNQWTGFGVAPKTLAMAIHSPLRNETYNVGLLVLSDRYGVSSKNRFMGAYAYRLKINKKINLRFGLQLGVEAHKVNFNELTIIQAGDATFTNASPKYFSILSGTGLYINSDNWFGGLSSPIIFASNPSAEQLFKPALAYGGYLYKINSEFGIQPSTLIKYIKNSPMQVDVNVLVNYREMAGAGISFRTTKTWVCNLYYNINPQLFVGYAIDVNTGKTAKLARTSHEIILKYQLGFARDLTNPKNFF